MMLLKSDANSLYVDLWRILPNCLVKEFRSQEPGVRSQESGARMKKFDKPREKYMQERISILRFKALHAFMFIFHIKYSEFWILSTEFLLHFLPTLKPEEPYFYYPKPYRR